MTLEERLRVPGIEPGRAPVIVAGLVILREILEAFGLDEIEASERDILHGAALAAAELPEAVEAARRRRLRLLLGRSHAAIARTGAAPSLSKIACPSRSAPASPHRPSPSIA